MDTDSKRQKRRENGFSLMDAASEAMNLSKEISSVAPAKVIFGPVGTLLTIIKVHFLLFYYDELRFIHQ